jgi:hypothetical protein
MYIGSTQPHGVRWCCPTISRGIPGSQRRTASASRYRPAFNAQITDDPANGIYRLKPGTTPKMQITRLDPGVTVNFN